MLNDVAWRKMPVDILSNETMTYIESKMPKGYEYAPFMFYQAALKKADDDGCFDLEDGIIFKRLMRVDDVKIVWLVATLMAQRRIIIHCSPNSNKCLLADWEYTKGATRTWSERKKIVEAKIAEEIKTSISTTFPGAEESAQNPIDFINFSDKSPEIDSNVVFGDKKTKNVTQNTFGDKIGENVTENNSIEREKERERERENTHTEREIESARGREREVSASAESLADSAPAPTEKKKGFSQKNKKAEQKEIKSANDSLSGVQTNECAVINNSDNEKENRKNHANSVTVEIVEKFFISESLGYDQGKGHNTCLQVAEKIKKVSTSDFPEEFIAQYAMLAFKEMHNETGIWHGIPLQPNMLLNDSVWAQVLSRIGQKIKAGKKKNEFLEKAKKAEAEADAEREKVQEETRKEYERFGINPDAPNRHVLLLQAKSKEQAEHEAQEDIF